MKHHQFSLELSLPKTINVTDQEIDISAMTPSQKEFYIDLFKELVRLYQSKKKPRVVIGIAGPAGSGKSVITEIFREIAKQRPLPFRLETVGIDAFHYPNDFLLTNTADGEPLKNHKGRFDTYDVPKLIETLTSFSLGNSVSFPLYSRKAHDPVEGALVIKKGEPTLLVVEGLWLLYDKSGWDRVGKLLDYSIFLEADRERVRNGVIDRHVRGGRTAENAAEYYEANEEKNFDIIMRTKKKANRIIPSYYDVE